MGLRRALETRKGRATINVRQVISLGGIASSKSNARVNEKTSAFIYHNFAVLVGMASSRLPGSIVMNLLDDRKAVANTRVGAPDEREQVAEDTRKRFNGLRNGFPTFWPVRAMSLDASTAPTHSG